MSLQLDTRQRAMLQEMGVRVWAAPEELPQTGVSDAPVVHPRIAVVAPTPVPEVKPAALLMPPGMPDLQQLDATGLAEAAATCTACGLCAGRKNTTLRATALVQSDWMLLGDPPDEDEDREGLAFTQQAGVLLDNMLLAAGKSRSASGAQGAYASNVVKCRPPHGRLPQASELAQCAAYLQREIALVQPKVIVSMGRFANQLLFADNPHISGQPLGKLRGSIHRYQGIAVVVTYAPKDLLRRSADKAKAWADMCLALDTN